MLNSNLETATFERLLKQISCRVLNLFHNLINLDIQVGGRQQQQQQQHGPDEQLFTTFF